MHVILMGAQGAGKGTQAEVIGPRFHLQHVSTGNLFRAAVQSGTDLGVLAKGYLDRGELVPDAVTIGIVDEALGEIARQRAAGHQVQGALLDGFPRTAAQAQGLDDALVKRGERIAAVVEVHVPKAILVERLAGRRVCTGCGATYHITFNRPATEGVCDRCGAALMQRSDDTPEAIERRLTLYFEQTEPLLAYYREKGLLHQIDGDRPIDIVSSAVAETLRASGLTE